MPDLLWFSFFLPPPGGWEPFRSLCQISAKYIPEAKTTQQIPQQSAAALSLFKNLLIAFKFYPKIFEILTRILKINMSPLPAEGEE
jgi:hypothetical protein